MKPHEMTLTRFPPAGLLAIAIFLLVGLSTCANLVRPNFTTELKTLRAGQYQLDPMHSFLIFRIDHLDLSKIVGRFNTMEASLDFDPENPTDLKLSGIITTDSIDLNNENLEETLQEESWFNAAQFPQITFDSTSVQLAADSTLEVDGTLSMRGVDQPVTLLAKFNGGADNILTRKYTIGFSATAQISRAAFGMDTFTAFIGDNIEVELHGEFQQQSE